MVALLMFGRDPIKPFIAVLLVGVIIGTYSSIFIASPLLVTWEKTAQKRAKSRRAAAAA